MLSVSSAGSIMNLHAYFRVYSMKKVVGEVNAMFKPGQLDQSGSDVVQVARTPHTPTENKDWREFICGWGAGTVNIALTYPINKIIFRQMLHGISAGSAFKDLHREGIVFLYRGALPPMCQKTISMSIMFGMYEQCRQPLVHHYHMNPYLAKTLAALVAGTMEATYMPLERIQNLMSVPTYHEHFKNTALAFRYVWKNYGIKEYYRGFFPILFRNGPSNAIFFILREEVQERLPNPDTVFRKTLQEFISGACLGVVCSTITYPLNVAKVSMQNQLGGPYVNFLTVLVQIYRDRGYKIRYIYHGLGTNCTRAFFSWGILNTTYEALRDIVY